MTISRRDKGRSKLLVPQATIKQVTLITPPAPDELLGEDVTDPIEIVTSIGGPKETIFVMKRATEFIANDAVLHDDEMLRFTVPDNFGTGFSQEWTADFHIYWDGPTAADLKWTFSTPPNWSYNVWSWALTFDAVDASNDKTQVDMDGITFVAGSLGSGLGTSPLIIRLMLLGNLGAGEAGEVIFRWAQNNATAGNTQVHQGSHLLAQRWQ